MSPLTVFLFAASAGLAALNIMMVIHIRKSGPDADLQTKLTASIVIQALLGIGGLVLLVGAP